LHQPGQGDGVGIGGLDVLTCAEAAADLTDLLL
jgi:hypothetical protein